MAYSAATLVKPVSRNHALARSRSADRNRRDSFTSPFDKAKEVKSGVAELETPSDSSAYSSEAESPVSTSSAPALYSSGAESPVSTSSAPASFTNTSAVSIAGQALKCSPPPVLSQQEIDTILYNTSLKQLSTGFERAQMIYPADSIIFVGNLPSSLNDLNLSNILLKHFRSIGPVYISIRRHQSPKGTMPYAYLQFTRLTHARTCLSQNKHAYIGPRQLRIAFSNACRQINVAHIDYSYVNEYEAYAVFGHFGFIESVSYTHQKCSTTIRYRSYGPFHLAQTAVQSGAMFGYMLL